ncbi:PREDICTED: OTU domain-containing protein 6B-like [Priapulus caudatus]|uniref:OTU domain-containing protein 6B-like n=1 Tax=Priapulus caudatus TaxID=37621 RepID=A0ABM1EFF6_PRICU|nr:PREDICTED: OTU domain-containing protein 6B-like [Priapulus caudatus]
MESRIQQLKHSLPKGDKKRKKDVNAEVAKLEEELSAKQQSQLDALRAEMQIQDVANLTGDLSVNDENCQPPIVAPKKLSKAQNKREKKAAEERKRAQRIAEQEKENAFGVRHIEGEKMKELLQSRNRAIHEIPSDGNCLYNAVTHQLRLHGMEATMQDLREQVAGHMRSNQDEFMPFLSKPDTGDPYTEEEFDNYCSEVSSTPAWGGQLEIRALCEVLRHPLEVLQADGPPIVVGTDFKTETLVIAYHRHAYGLGAHYNSTVTTDDSTPAS